MNYTEFTDNFVEMEEQTDLLELTIGKIRIWQFIRTTIFEDLRLQKSYGNFESSDQKRKNLCSTKLKIKELLDFFLHNQYFFRKKDLLFVSHPRKIIENGEYICKYTDEFIKHCKYSHYVFEYGYGRENIHFRNKGEKGVRYIGCEYFFKRLFKEKYNTQEIESVTNQIYVAIKERFGMRVPDDFRNTIFNRINQFLATWQGKQKYYSFILKQIRPKVIILANEYSVSNSIFIYWARKLGIPTVALQHGIVGRQHSAYNYPAGTMNAIDIFPDYFFLWGNFHRRDVRWPISDERIMSIGFPYFEKKRIENANNVITDKQSTRIKILFVSGEVELAEVAVELSALLDDGKYELVYRLHPKEFDEWEDKYHFLKDSKVHVNDDYDADLYEMLLESDCIICTGSTCAIESAALGKKTIIMKVGNYDLNLYLVNGRFAYLANSVSELLDLIQNKEEIEGNRLELVCENAIYNFMHEIEKIVYEARRG